MSFMGYLKSQLLDFIEWEDSSQDTIVHKIDMRNNEIQNRAWLTVRHKSERVGIFPIFQFLIVKYNVYICYNKNIE